MKTAVNLALVLALGHRLIAILRRRRSCLGREGLQPVLVLGAIAARLALAPLLGGKQCAVEENEGRQRLDPVLGESPQHPRRALLAVDAPRISFATTGS